MSLAYDRDKYRKLSDDVLNDNIDINNKEHREYLYKELKSLGESNIEERIKKISKYNKDKSERLNLVKDIFREVNGESKPEINIITKSESFKKELEERNERKISTDKLYKEHGCIKIKIKNYNRYDKYEDISQFIKTEGKHIDINIKSLDFEKNNLNLILEYKISFKKRTKPGEYKESIEITFRDVESVIYEFFIICNEENNKVYNFSFKNIDELYEIFKSDIKKYNNEENDFTDVIDIFKNRDFPDYLRYIKEYAALDLYKNFNLRIYQLEDINLFFTTLGYQQCHITINNDNVKEEKENFTKPIKEDINLRFLKFYHIENIDNDLKIKVFSNRNNDIEIKKVKDLVPYKVEKLLKKVINKKLEEFNSYILIRDKHIFKHLFTYLIRKEDIGKSFMILISTKKSENELNLYSLKIHM